MKNKTQKNDFYMQINHKWLKTHKIQENKSSLDLFNILERKINIDLKDCFETLKKNNKKVGKICKSFQKQNNDLVIQEIFAIWQHFEESEDNIYETFSLSIKYGIDILVSVVVDDDYKLPENKCVTIIETCLSSPNIMIFKHPQSSASKKFRNVFITFLKNLFCCVFGENHSFKVEDIWDIEVEISKHMYKVPSVPIETFYNVYKTNKLFHSFDFKKLISVIGLKNIPSKIIIHNPNFFHHYQTLFNAKKLKLFILYRLIVSYSRFHKELEKLCFSFYSEYLRGIHKEEPFITESYKHLRDGILNTSLNKEYAKVFNGFKEKQYCKDLVSSIVKQIVIRLEQNTFLHKRTKEKAIDKIKSVNFVIGCSEKFQTCFVDTVRLEDLSDENPFINMQLFRDFVKKQMLETFDKKRILLTKEWDKSKCGNVFDVNAYYLNGDNTIVIPLGILKPPFLDMKKSYAYNLAFLGSTIGHELFHAIDDEGCKFDKLGNYKNWWTKEDLLHYKQSQNSIVKTYEKYARQQDNLKINGTISLGENIADIGGMLVAEMVLLETIKEKVIKGFNEKEGLNGKEERKRDKLLKDFFISYAKQWRILYSKKEFEIKRFYDVHALYKYRTNCVLLFSKHFQRLYNHKDVVDHQFFW
jgi:putative endopeptidase